jgi:ligand-binding sensor domain-containing protein
MRRTKAALIYRRTKNLRVVQLLLGHSKLESTVRYLGIDVDDALEIAEQTDICITPSNSRNREYSVRGDSSFSVTLDERAATRRRARSAGGGQESTAYGRRRR